MADDVAVPRDVGRDDGEARAHRVKHGEGQPFLLRRRHVQVDRREDASRLVEPAREDDAAVEARAGRQAPEPVALGPAPHEEQRDARASQRAERADERVEPLDRVEARDGAQHEQVRREAEALARERRARDEAVLRLEVHAVEDGRALRQGEEPEGERLGLLRRGDGDDRAGPAREPALEREIELRQTRRVALVMDTVEGVDGGHADPARGEPPVEAGTLAVRVDNLDLALADEPERRPECPGVEPVGTHLRDREPERAKPVEEDSVVGRRHRDLELVAGEPARQVVHLPRATAERARREQLEDADHARAGDTEAAPSPCPGCRYSSRGGAKMSRTTQRASSVRPPCGTFGGVCQKSPAFT